MITSYINTFQYGNLQAKRSSGFIPMKNNSQKRNRTDSDAHAYYNQVAMPCEGPRGLIVQSSHID